MSLRREEAIGLKFEDIQIREDSWTIPEPVAWGVEHAWFRSSVIT